MHREKRKNRAFSSQGRSKKIWLALACLVMMSFFAPMPAHAFDFSNSPNLGIGGPQICPDGYGLTRRLVPCIRDTILIATNTFIIPFSAYMADAVKAACVIAIIMWAVSMLSGTETAPIKDAMVTVVKIAAVLIFCNNFGEDTATGTAVLDPANKHGGTFGLVLDIMDELLNIVTGYVVTWSQFGQEGNCPKISETVQSLQVWNSVDCVIETLIGGIFSPLTLSAGIVGFLTACLFSNTVGFIIGIAGVYLIYKILYAIFKCTYIYISAYLGVAIMVIISPLFIPTLLFKPTKSYFDRWLKLFLGFIIQPLVIFAYLAMLLAAFNVTVVSGRHSLYNTIAGGDACFLATETDDDSCGDGVSKGQLGTWMLNIGGYTDKDVGGQAIVINSKTVKAAGLVPKSANDTGALGKVSNLMLDYAQTQQNGIMNTLGINGANPKFFEIDIPEQTVDWDHLAQANGFDGSDDAHSTTSYVLNVLVSAFMALLVGYIFVDILEILPFISNGLALSGGLADGKLSGGLDTDKLSGSGGDFAKNLKFGAGAKKL